jgi:ferredoxin
MLTRAKPRHGSAGLYQTISTAEPVLSGLGYGTGAVGTIETDDPDDMLARIAAAPLGTPASRPASFLPEGRKRDVLKLALRELHRAAPVPTDRIALPEGAVFGRVDVRVEGCTLCLACVSACPTHALGDAPDRPLLRFDESLCVQCGLCQATCPEKVIRLEPRLDFAAFEAGPVAVKEEEPFCCTRCGKPFGVKSTIERVAAKLEGQHWMYSGEHAARVDLIRMCDDCRVAVTTEASFDPYAAKARPAGRTSEDYFREREAKEREAKAREQAMLDKIERGEA